MASAAEHFEAAAESDPPNCTSLPPITARIVARSFEAGNVELRVIGAMNETEKIDERAQNHFTQKSQTYPIALNSDSKD
ncbi:MAG: cobalamin B12-binding domain-containing protein [Mesorhizobium sp.]|nr:MAG: cobalamin B12-binding domain-containing protein [Mesorhizobium sp.]